MNNIQNELNEIDHILNFYFNLIKISNGESSDGLNKDEEYLEWRNDILERLLNEDLEEEDLDEFDDSEILDLIKDYKSTVEELDDTVFLDALEEMKNFIDINKFNELLDQKHFNEEEAEEIQEMIDKSSEIISDKLNSRIKVLLKTYQKLS